MNIFIPNTKTFLASILTSKEIKKTKYSELLKSLTEGQTLLDNLNENTFKNMNDLTGIQYDTIIMPLPSLVATNSVQFITLFLDYLRNLVASNILSSLCSHPQRSNQEHSFTSLLVRNLFNCYKNLKNPESVELSIILILTSLSVGNEAVVHKTDLINVIKLFIYASCRSKSPSSREAAKASLSNVVISVLARLESVPEVVDKNPFASCASEDNSEEITKEDNGSKANAGALEVDLSQHTENDDRLSSRVSLTNAEFDRKSENDFSTLELISNLEIGKEFKIDWDNNKISDTLVLYYTLCRGSLMKQAIDNLQKQLNMELVKVCMEMIHLLLNKANDVFRNNECFVEVTRKYLFVSLTQNSITLDQKLFKLAINIFLLLLEKFRSSLKLQIQVFFEDILFRIIEAVPPMPNQALIVLRELKNIFKSSKFMSVLFVNYDCDLESHNIFERLIKNICSLAKTPNRVLFANMTPSNQTKHLEMVNYIRLTCIKCLTSLLTLIREQLEKTTPTGEKGNDESSDHKKVDKNSKGEKNLSSTKERKELLAEGINIFNKNSINGIKFLQEHSFIGTDPDSVASFLHQEERLNKTKIGMILGEPNDPWLSVMHKYVEKIEVVNMDFLEAIRLFLSNFRLPGEAQKIDRLMEKFASHYFETNRNSKYFQTADMAYTLAYSIIILTTDLHNPRVKRKITPKQYIDMNRNTDGTMNLPEEYLLSIYDSILKNEIKLKSSKSDTLDNRDQHGEGVPVSRDLENIAKMHISKMQQISSFAESFVEIEPLDANESLFNTIWKHLFVCFGWVFNECDDEDIISECMAGVQSAIRISCLFSITLARDSFIKSLISSTSLSNNTNSDLKNKNLMAIRTLLLVAKEDGDHLDNTWTDIVHCFSNLDVFQNFGYNENQIFSSLTSIDTESSRKNSKQANRSKIRTTNNEYETQKLMPENVYQRFVVSMDQLFTNSFMLNADSIIYLVESLCAISSMELFMSKKPRSFTLQKIVEVAFYNLGRTRIEWSRIWSILGPFFIKAASLESKSVSIFCIDAIRQLSNKFLQKKELSNFHFQSQFFKPFEHIMIHNNNMSVKEHGLRCVLQIVESCSENIRSGWESIFKILHLAALNQTLELEEIAFLSINIIIDKHFELIIEYLDAALQSIKAFAMKNDSQTTNIRAIKLLGSCYEQFAKFVPTKNLLCDKEGNIICTEEDFIWNNGWSKILFILVDLIQNTSSFVRAESLLLIFNLLKNYQYKINNKWWISLFEILFSIFDVLKTPDDEFSSKKKAIWLTETCTGAMMGTLELYISNFENIPIDVTSHFLNHFKIAIKGKHEILTATALYCFRRMLKVLGHKYNQNCWDLITDFVDEAFDAAKPTLLLEKGLLIAKNITTKVPPSLLSDSSMYDPSTDREHPFTLTDYSSYSVEMLRKYAPLVLNERENCTSQETNEVHNTLSKCRLDLEFLEGIDSLLEFNEPSFHNSQKNSENTAKSTFSYMPHENILKFVNILEKHEQTLVGFNINQTAVTYTASYVESVCPAIQELWKGKIKPVFLVEELMCRTCSIKLLLVHCQITDYSLDYLDIINKNLCAALIRYKQLNSSYQHNTHLHNLLHSILMLITRMPKQFFMRSIVCTYKHIWPVIGLKNKDNNTELLEKLFSMLEEAVSALDQ